tara:strand:+ start:5593 stop:7149 length:1557 start_codon:yes stop_codon:yes gene_type:complete
MEKLTPIQVLKRADKANNRKDQWRSIYEECYEYGLPQRNLYGGHYESRVPAQDKSSRVFDSTAIHATQRFANRIQSALFPPYRKWCALVAGEDAIREVDDPQQLQIALDIYTEKMFAVIRQSSFDLAMSEFLLDLCVGTAVMLIQPGDEVTPIRFEAVPQYLVSLEEGPNGTIDNVYRKHRVRAEAIERQWPDANIHSDLQDIIKDKPEDEIDLLEATIYKKEEDIYCYHVIDVKKKEEIVYRVLKSSPWVVSRYMKVSGEVMGRGPLISCIADVKTLNKTKELILKNASLAIAGVYTAADDGVLNPQNVRIQPGAIIPVARNGGPQGESLKPLQRASDFDVAQLVIQDLRDNIKKVLLDDSLPPDNMSARSATEIVQRMKELSQNMGSAFGRLITEAMLPIVSRVLVVMDEQNLIDMPLKVDGQAVKVVPVSPLAQAQSLDELENVMKFIQITQGIGPIGQVALNQDEALDYIADKLGVPGKILNSKEERKTMMAQMAEMAQQAMAAEEEQVTEEAV